ncbi:MAG: hypothetical protein OXD30_07390, partial [Bryobacterales bacterium]|nr:hypothetical protein [Bryobacterales bacterium]
CCGNTAKPCRPGCSPASAPCSACSARSSSTTFRSLKSELGLRPIWHRLDRRVAAHLFVAVLAYHGVHWSWQSLRARLAGWMRVTTSVQSADGQLLCSRGPRPCASPKRRAASRG